LVYDASSKEFENSYRVCDANKCTWLHGVTQKGSKSLQVEAAQHTLPRASFSEVGVVCDELELHAPHTVPRALCADVSAIFDEVEEPPTEVSHPIYVPTLTMPSHRQQGSLSVKLTTLLPFVTLCVKYRSIIPISFPIVIYTGRSYRRNIICTELIFNPNQAIKSF
jgi:hypothetical protein